MNSNFKASRAFLVTPLAFLAVTLAVGHRSDELPVPARTHTFGSYLVEAIMTPLLPVFVSTVRVERTYANVSQATTIMSHPLTGALMKEAGICNTYHSHLISG